MLYHHYESRNGLIRALIVEMGVFVDSRIREIAKTAPPEAALLEWMGTGVEVIANYGLLGLEAASDSLPPELACPTRDNSSYEFTDHLLKRLADSGACQPRISTHSGARLWACLAHPKRVLRALDEGMSLREIEAETLDWFFSVFSPGYEVKLRE